MTEACRSDDVATLGVFGACRPRWTPRNRRAMLRRLARHAHDAQRRASTQSAAKPAERPSQRLRRILTSNPRARHFSVRRIVGALGERGHASTLALFSAAGVFEAPDIAHLSAVMTGAVGVQLTLRRESVMLPRALLRRKIPRRSLVALIGAVANLLESAEAFVQPRWDWVFHPAMGVALGLLLFLLGVASMTPFLGLTANHAASAFVMSIGLAERDGLAVIVGAVAGMASLAMAAANAMSGRRIWANAKRWLVNCLKRLRLQFASAFLDRMEQGLGELLRVSWSGLLLLFASDVGGRADGPELSSVSSGYSLKERARSIRRASRDAWWS
jgi:hypothetical protein